MPQDATNKLPPEMVQALTEQLRDVHLPEAISWWPLAWGWWVLLVLIICAASTTIWLIKRSINKNRYRGLATTELKSAFRQWNQDNNNMAYLQNANAILKRAVLHTTQQASLTTNSGQAWVELLNNWSAQTLSETSQNALAYGCYQANCDTDIKAVHTELVTWLKKHQTPSAQAPNKTKQAAMQAERGQHA